MPTNFEMPVSDIVPKKQMDAQIWQISCNPGQAFLEVTYHPLASTFHCRRWCRSWTWRHSAIWSEFCHCRRWCRSWLHTDRHLSHTLSLYDLVTHRQRDRRLTQTHCHLVTHRPTERERERDSCHRHTVTVWLRYTQTDRQTDRQTSVTDTLSLYDLVTHRQTDRQIDYSL